MAFTVTGMDAVLQRLQQIQTQTVHVAAIALQQEADAILEQSRTLVPVDTASLRDSGAVDTPQLTATSAHVTIRYGGTVGYQGRVPERYAILIHENMFIPHPRGGQSHFLALPLFAAANQDLVSRLGDAIALSL